ncbi:MAG TPA: hypothetical protein VGU23_07110 [Acidobacteriaceae bacterium]|nr:hypothetical protein [Acidobacteriaceae bacterium]
MNLRLSRIGRMLLTVSVSCMAPQFCPSQAVPAGGRAPGSSDVDIFVGYSYLHPHNSDIYGQPYFSLPDGFIAAGTVFFSHSFGIEGEYSRSPNQPDYCFSTGQAGPAFRHQWGRLIPYAHVLGGAVEMGPSYEHGGASNQCDWGWAAEAGIGVDYVLPAPALRNRFAIRAFQGDFQYAQANFGPQLAIGSLTGGQGQIFAYRLSAGLVYRIGEMPSPLPASMDCELQPVSVYAGDPINVTGSTLNLEGNKRHPPIYTWTTTGGKLSRAEDGATIATTGLAPGDYTVTGRVSEGNAINQHAECTASFRVAAFQPPTVSCSANPSSILPGGFATITASGISPQNRSLNYSYGTTAGQITGTGNTATLSAADVPPGTINVSCNVVDDMGQSASATAAVVVSAPPAPPPPPIPAAHSLCSISFERDRKRPVRVDNEAKGCLDDIALALNREADAVLVVVGKHDPQEKPDAAAERTLNVKQYLTQEKGIDASRIELRTGETTGRTVDNVLVPQGATWDAQGTTSFDPARVQRHGEPYSSH